MLLLYAQLFTNDALTIQYDLHLNILSLVKLASSPQFFLVIGIFA